MDLWFKKIKSFIWLKIVSYFRNTRVYPMIYLSFWHSLLFSKKKNKENYNYLTATPNPGAGIGHQISNWIAGYWFSKKFNLNYAHSPFTSQEWEDFLGFGDNEIKAADLVGRKGYKQIRLPLFDENNLKEFTTIKKIINSYKNEKIVFLCEQDQFYKDQYGVQDDIKKKFYQSNSRKNDKLIYDVNNYNIAIHIRRGDIIKNLDNNKNHLQRWQANDYFFNTLENVMKILKTNKKVVVYLFSQGLENEFQEFSNVKNINFCLDMSARETFLHLIYADLLIMSKSSFSYKPGLLSNGTKVCPRNFWHSYPKNQDWIIVEENGSITQNKI